MLFSFDVLANVSMEMLIGVSERSVGMSLLVSTATLQDYTTATQMLPMFNLTLGKAALLSTGCLKLTEK